MSTRHRNAMAEGGVAEMYPDPEAPDLVVNLVLVGRDHPDAFEGLTEADRELVRVFSKRTGPSNIFRVIEGARAAGYAIVFRTDLPPID